MTLLKEVKICQSKGVWSCVATRTAAHFSFLKKLLDKLKGRSEDSENIVKIEETYEQYQERKKKNREKQRKSIN